GSRGRRPSATSGSRRAPPGCPSSPAAEPAPPSSSTGRSPPWSSTIPRTWTRSERRSPGRSDPRGRASAGRRDGSPNGCRGTRTSSGWRRSSRRWRVSAERPAGERCVVRRGLHAWLAPGIQLADVAPGGDPDRLLTRPDCEMVKLQQKVAVGVLTTPAGRLYIKRYNVFAWRVALGNVWRRSPALGAWRAAHVLGARGFATPEPLGAVEVRRAGILEKSFFVTREVPAARTADQRW